MAKVGFCFVTICICIAEKAFIIHPNFWAWGAEVALAETRSLFLSSKSEGNESQRRPIWFLTKNTRFIQDTVVDLLSGENEVVILYMYASRYPNTILPYRSQYT
jgi:hypothetical protein